ncbi:hypothetical protein P0Y35_11325 [Kiritimatiellaeota bacterium B1221]|nr:hypothetical protein [Kiritimatiellaeota bacterium B1221]
MRNTSSLPSVMQKDQEPFKKFANDEEIQARLQESIPNGEVDE